MNFNYQTSTKELSKFVHTVNDDDYLSDFVDQFYFGLIWDRQIPVNIQDWLNKVDPKLIPSFRQIFHKNEVNKNINKIFKNTIIKQKETEWLVQDIIRLSRLFSNLMKVDYLRLRMEVVSTNSCRKFHIDAVKSRLICTYRGQGTQYGLSMDSNDPEQFKTTPTSSPILLRGTLWIEDKLKMILHRSPPIEGTGETRFVFVIDPIFDLENEA